MTTMLEQGQKVVRGERTPPPIARLLGFVMKSIEPGHAVDVQAAHIRAGTYSERGALGTAFQ